MTNNVRKLIVESLTWGSDEVEEVEILYKESHNTAIYSVDTINKKDYLGPGAVLPTVFEIKSEMKNLVILLSSEQNNKPFISLMISEDLVKTKSWNAGLIIRELAKEIKGGGGGQPFFATAGGSDVSGLKNVSAKARGIFK